MGKIKIPKAFNLNEIKSSGFYIVNGEPVSAEIYNGSSPYKKIFKTKNFHLVELKTGNIFIRKFDGVNFGEWKNISPPEPVIKNLRFYYHPGWINMIPKKVTFNQT